MTIELIESAVKELGWEVPPWNLALLPPPPPYSRLARFLISMYVRELTTTTYLVYSKLAILFPDVRPGFRDIAGGIRWDFHLRACTESHSQSKKRELQKWKRISVYAAAKGRMNYATDAVRIYYATLTQAYSFISTGDVVASTWT